MAAKPWTLRLVLKAGHLLLLGQGEGEERRMVVLFKVLKKKERKRKKNVSQPLHTCCVQMTCFPRCLLLPDNNTTWVWTVRVLPNCLLWKYFSLIFHSSASWMSEKRCTSIWGNPTDCCCHPGTFCNSIILSVFSHRQFLIFTFPLMPKN